MLSAPAPSAGATVDHRTALLSIVGFWLFYFVLVSIRSVALGFDGQLELLGLRTLVTVASMAITYAMALALRRVAGRPLRTSIVVACLFAIPASLAHSTLNYHAFREIDLHDDSPVVVTRTDDDRNVTIQVGAAADYDRLSPLQEIAERSVNAYFFFVAWAALYLALGYAAAVRAAERQAATYRAAARDAEIRALRYQVNPHFLFNTLNSLSGLVMTGKRDEAERMILNLSTFFRTSLTGDPTEDVSLKEEIRLQRLYLEIEAQRFPERLRVAIDVPEPLEDACVPGLILQPLVENAIKYGVSRARRPVRLDIRARAEGDRLELVVEDDGDTVPTEGGSGIGLRNVAERLAARFGSAATARWGRRDGGGFVVTLSLPVVRHGC